MSPSTPAPKRSLPARPSLGQLRKQAKELLKAYHAGNEAAVAEVNRFERFPDSDAFQLADAQRVLARSYGFSSWTKLKLHVDGFNVQAFCAAVEAGDVGRVRALAKSRPELVTMSPDGEFGERIPLHLAVLKRDVGMTRVLMELGSDARRGIWPHRSSSTPFAIAQDRGYDEIVEIIEQEEQRRRQAMSCSGATIGSSLDQIQKAILQDRNDEALQLLESDLSVIGSCNRYGATPLHVAAWAHNVEVMRWLLDHGASVDAEAQFDAPLGAESANLPGKTPLDFAAMVAGWSAHGRHFSFLENSAKGPQRFIDTVQLLRSHGARLTARSAVATGDSQSVLEMHRCGKLDNEIHVLRGGLLSIAVRVNRPEMVSLLLDLGLDPDEAVPGEDGSRMSWGMPLWFTAMCGRPEIAEILLSRGADVNAIVAASGDAISIAHDIRDEDMKSLLRQHGARLTVEQVAGEGDIQTAQAILEGRIKAHSLNVAEPTLADLAEQMLWAAGGEERLVRLCLPYVSKKHDDPWWNYVLLHATIPDGFEVLLQHGIDPDVEGSGGYTILHHLASDYCAEENRVVRATMLLQAGASLSKRDPLLRSTPLGWACRWGRVELVKLYLQHGADPVEADAEPWATPSAWATKGGHRAVLELLRVASSLRAVDGQ